MNNINILTIVLMIGLISIILVAFVQTSLQKNNFEKFENNKENTDGICRHDCKAKLPVWEAIFNIKEIIKQMLLLEDHLFQKGKQCGECIRKHILTIEGFAEEGITLDTKKQYISYFIEVSDLTRKIYDDFMTAKTDEDVLFIAQNVRVLRKKLMTIS